MTRRTVVCVVGTRPEVIKMAPLVQRLRRIGPSLGVRIVATGQHRELTARALADFALAADVDLDLMRAGQGLAELTARALVALDEAFGQNRPDLVLAQGDTSTVLATALACHYQQIPFGHVEAGLRTHRPYFPFPEEKKRVLTSHLAALHFCPTAASRRNLLAEGIDPGSIHVTGNTVIDALLLTADRPIRLPVVPATDRFILVTAHRRENWGGPLKEICLGLRDLIDRDPGLSLIFPVHPNPGVREIVGTILGRSERVQLIEPVGYPEFVALMKGSYLIVTDSGGIQEEAPALGKPVLVLRVETERPEAVAAGTVRLVGPDRSKLVAAVDELRQVPEAYARFARTVNPYGDGHASERISRVIASRLGLGPIEAGPLPDWPPLEHSEWGRATS
jgi:UDP-N-acetylglucosamine 2-epimerase (non-hydrolysing)